MSTFNSLLLAAPFALFLGVATNSQPPAGTQPGVDSSDSPATTHCKQKCRNVYLQCIMDCGLSEDGSAACRSTYDSCVPSCEPAPSPLK